MQPQGNTPEQVRGERPEEEPEERPADHRLMNNPSKESSSGETRRSGAGTQGGRPSTPLEPSTPDSRMVDSRPAGTQNPRSMTDGSPAGDSSASEPNARGSSTPDEPVQQATESGGTGEVQSNPQQETTPLLAQGALVWATPAGPGPPQERLVAVLFRQGQWCLPRVLLSRAELPVRGARRAAATQVHPQLQDAPSNFLATLEGSVQRSLLRTDYWGFAWEGEPTDLLPNCHWLPLTKACQVISFAEESRLLSTMKDPLADPPISPSLGGELHSGGSPNEGDAPAPRHTTSSVSASKGLVRFGGSQSKPMQQVQDLQATIDAAKQALAAQVKGGDWRLQIQSHLERAQAAVEGGDSELAQASLTAAWKLEFETRSVGERRLWTRLLQGQVRAQTHHWRREVLLGALEESPDAGTLAMVRAELATQTRNTRHRVAAGQRARIVQLVVAIPFLAVLLFELSYSWLEGELPPPVALLAPVLGLGMLGGLTWSALRQFPHTALAAVAPLGAGAFAGLFGFLAGRADIVPFGRDSSPTILCLSVIWGVLGATLLEFKRRSSGAPPNE